MTDKLLLELEERLEENRKIAQNTKLPIWLHGVASYLGFHALSTLILLSLLITVILYEFFHQPLITISKSIFLL